jgi:hypothetical protein
MTGRYEDIEMRPGGTTLKVKVAGSLINTKTFNVVGNFAAHQSSAPGDANSFLDVTRSIAMSKALRQIHKAQIAMSGGTFLGELGEAIHMLRNPAEGLRKAIKGQYLDKLAKLKRRDPNRWKKAISQSWLEGCFGWRPFINDLEDAAKAYQQIQEKSDRTTQIKAIGKASKLFLIEGPSLVAPISSFTHKYYAETRHENFTIIRGQVRSLAATTALEQARVFGLTAGEFLPTAWELLPWSFLADYFTNIGDIIENAVTDTTGVTWLEQADVTQAKKEAMMQHDVQSNMTGWGTNFIYCGGKPSYAKWTKRVVSRTGVVTLRVPPLMLELPGSPMKQLNMLALWTQANSLNPQDVRKLRGRSLR